jgi:hypothetical protein
VRGRQLYVGRSIRCDLDELWQATQDPARHQRWDVRFGTISYLPEPGPRGERRLRYSLRVGPVTIRGTGHCKTNGLVSGLRFGSPDPLSLIRSGSGYWRYEVRPDGVRLSTGYDYRPGWGPLGPAADRLFRPLLGWGTAWSFDRLRLWLERGTPPEALLRRALAEAATRAAAAGLAWWLTPVPVAVAVTAAALFVPPLPGTPAARRCDRTRPEETRCARSSRPRSATSSTACTPRCAEDSASPARQAPRASAPG